MAARFSWARRVLRIVVRDGTARGVELLAGPARAQRRVFVRAPIVVSNADLLQTLEQMIEPQIVGSELLGAGAAVSPSYPCFLMHVGLRGVPTELLRACQGYYWDGWDSDRVGMDALRFKLFVPTLYEPDMAPPGGHVLIVQKVQAMDYRAITDWRAHKRAVDEFILSGLERLIPGITKHMVVRLSATASTHQRYTLNHQGAMLGWEMSPDQLAPLETRRVGPDTRLLRCRSLDEARRRDHAGTRVGDGGRAPRPGGAPGRVCRRGRGDDGRSSELQGVSV